MRVKKRVSRKGRFDFAVSRLDRKTKGSPTGNQLFYPAHFLHNLGRGVIRLVSYVIKNFEYIIRVRSRSRSGLGMRNDLRFKLYISLRMT